MENYNEAGVLGAFAGFLAAFFIFAMALGILMLICQWKIYSKAGKPGWASLIPIYNIIVLLEIVGKPLWWLLLLFIPFVNIYAAVVITHRLSLSFGKDTGFTVGLIFLGFIFYPILAFGDATYIGPGGEGPDQQVPAFA